MVFPITNFTLKKLRRQEMTPIQQFKSETNERNIEKVIAFATMLIRFVAEAIF